MAGGGASPPPLRRRGRGGGALKRADVAKTQFGLVVEVDRAADHAAAKGRIAFRRAPVLIASG